MSQLHKYMVTLLFSASLDLFFCSSAFLLLSVDGIVSFFKKQAGPASVELKDDADFQKFIADEDASVIGELLFEFQSSSSLAVNLCVY